MNPSDNNSSDNKRNSESETRQDRRTFLDRSWKALAAIVVAEATWGSWEMLRPSKAAAFGGVVKAGDPADFPEGSVRYFSEGRFYVTSFEGRLSALYQKCPHLGCRVPFCTTSNQFECPCHGSVYNIKGEYIKGPAPRGMDRFPVTIENDQVLIDTAAVLEGPPHGVLTGPPEATGPTCNGVYPPLPDLSSGAHSHGGAPAAGASQPPAPASAAPEPSSSPGGGMSGMDGMGSMNGG
jgi:cytochrome b6-f complex iron-sulfur subunit